jgi:hypothetical protein
MTKCVHPGARGTRTGSDDAPFSRCGMFAGSRPSRANTTKPESIQSLLSPVQHAAAGTALRRASVGVRASMAPGVPRLRSQRLGPAARGTAGKHQGCSVSVANNKTIQPWAAKWSLGRSPQDLRQPPPYPSYDGKAPRPAYPLSVSHVRRLSRKPRSARHRASRASRSSTVSTPRDT